MNNLNQSQPQPQAQAQAQAQAQPQDMNQILEEIKKQPQTRQIIRCLPECPSRLTIPITTIRYDGVYTSLGLSWFIEFEAQGLCDVCLAVLRSSNWVFFDPRFPPFNASSTPSVPITTIPLTACDFNAIFKEYCSEYPGEGRPKHCLCNAREGLGNCRLVVRNWGVTTTRPIRCNPFTIIVRHYVFPNIPCGGVIALICQTTETRPPPQQCPQPIGGVLTCYCCRLNPNRLESIFNVKEDYEVLKGLTIGTSAWEDDFDISIIRKLKQIV